MNVELLYFDGCPNHEPALARLRALIATEAPHATLQLVRIASDEEAHARRFLGSPTVRVDGRDVEPGADARSDYGMKCRLYRLDDGLAGTPPDDLMVAALRT